MRVVSSIGGCWGGYILSAQRKSSVGAHAFRSVFITCRTFFGTCTSSNCSSEGRTHNWGANSISCTHRASKRICKTKTTCRFSNRNLGLRSLFKRIQRAQTKLSGEVDAPTSRQKLQSKTWNLFCLVHTCAPTEDFLGADNISVYTIHEYFKCAPSGTSANRSSEGKTHNWGAGSISCTHRANKRICKFQTKPPAGSKIYRKGCEVSSNKLKGANEAVQGSRRSKISSKAAEGKNWGCGFTVRTYTQNEFSVRKDLKKSDPLPSK